MPLTRLQPNFYVLTSRGVLMCIAIAIAVVMATTFNAAQVPSSRERPENRATSGQAEVQTETETQTEAATSGSNRRRQAQYFLPQHWAHVRLRPPSRVIHKVTLTS